MSEDVTSSVHSAVLDLVAQHGLGEVSRTSVASQAGVSRQTLYNRWESVGDMLLSALLTRAEGEIGGGDAGEPDSVESTRAYLRDFASAVNTWASSGLRAVVAQALRDPAFERRFREEFLAPRHGRLVAAVGCAGGPTRVDAHRVAELIAGSMWYRLLVTGQPLDEAWVDEMTELARTGEVATTTARQEARDDEPPIAR